MRSQEQAQGSGRENIPSRLSAVSAEPEVQLELMSGTLNGLSHPSAPINIILNNIVKLKNITYDA